MTKYEFTDYKCYNTEDGEVDSRPIQTYTKNFLNTIKYIVENTPNKTMTLKYFKDHIKNGIIIEDDGIFFTEVRQI